MRPDGVRLVRPGASRAAAYGSLLLGGGLALLAGAQPWWRAVGTGAAGEGTAYAAFPGTQTTGGLSQALAVVVLVGVLLSLTLRVRGRRLLGVLLAAVGAGVVVLGALRARPSDAAVAAEVRTVTLADAYALVGTAWPGVYLAGGVLVLAGAGLTVVTAGRWPARPDRYQRVAPVADQPQDPLADWRALDAGLDPTEKPAAEPGNGPGHARDVHQE